MRRDQALLYFSKPLQRHIRVFQENREIQVASRMDKPVHGRAELKNQLNGMMTRNIRKIRCFSLRPLHVSYVVLYPGGVKLRHRSLFHSAVQISRIAECSISILAAPD